MLKGSHLLPPNGNKPLESASQHLDSLVLGIRRLGSIIVSDGINPSVALQERHKMCVCVCVLQVCVHAHMSESRDSHAHLLSLHRSSGVTWILEIKTHVFTLVQAFYPLSCLLGP